MKSQRKITGNLPVAILIGSFVIAVAIILTTLINVFSPKQNPPDTYKTYENISYVKVDESPALGDENAPLTIIEYTDFDCPICKAASDEVVPSMKQEYIATGKAKFIFKSLPLEYIHPNAFRKTEAAFCAREIGGDKAFFAYYDSLFANFGFSINLDNELTAIAEKNGLDTNKFRSCLTSGRYKDSINKEIVEAQLIGSLGTPTWLIGKTDGNGMSDAVKVSGLLEYSAFRTIINQLLEEN